MFALRTQLSVRTAEADAAVSSAVKLGQLLKQSNTPVQSPQRQPVVQDAGTNNPDAGIKTPYDGEEQQQDVGQQKVEEPLEAEAAHGAVSPSSGLSAAQSNSPVSAGEELWI